MGARQRAAAALGVALLHTAVFLSWAPPFPPRVTQADVAAQDRPVTRVTLAPLAPPLPSQHQLIRTAVTKSVSASRSATHDAPPSIAPEQLPPAQTASEGKGWLNDHTQSEPQAGSVDPSAPASANAELPSTTAEYLDNPPPAYPSVSQHRGEHGRVMVSVLVTAEGLVKEAFVEQSSGFPRLDEAAVAAVRAWRFVPAKRRGVNVEMRHRIPIRFELDLIPG